MQKGFWMKLQVAFKSTRHSIILIILYGDYFLRASRIRSDELFDSNYVKFWRFRINLRQKEKGKHMDFATSTAKDQLVSSHSTSTVLFLSFFMGYNIVIANFTSHVKA